MEIEVDVGMRFMTTAQAWSMLTVHCYSIGLLCGTGPVSHSLAAVFPSITALCGTNLKAPPIHYALRVCRQSIQWSQEFLDFATAKHH